jgi:hypothetical protein
MGQYFPIGELQNCTETLLRTSRGGCWREVSLGGWEPVLALELSCAPFVSLPIALVSWSDLHVSVERTHGRLWVLSTPA